MKQLLQNLRNGKSVVAEVPVPLPTPGAAQVRTAISLVSAGTERMVVEFAEKNLLAKAQSRPDLVRQVLDKARREGLLTTLEAAMNRLDQPMALGYSSAGTITALGENMPGFQVGDRVACAGSGHAVHAEYAVIPRNLLARLPDHVDFEAGAFTTLGAIALHGFRLAQPQIGERVAVIGLGLLGLLAAGIARAAGCVVFGIDLDPARISLGSQIGATCVPRQDAESAAASFSQGSGFDVVLICADARSDDPVELAGSIAGDRGRVIALGATGLKIPRKVYYEKELTFLVSRSYGPGRYDPIYEEQGIDYPPGYVRWTEGRNLQAFVDLLAAGKIDIRPLISHRFAIEQASEAYALITAKTGQPFLGVLLTYPQSAASQPATRVAVQLNPPAAPPTKALRLGVLGAGNYATAVFLPTVQKTGGVARAAIASASGLSARHAARRFGFQDASSSEEDILADPEINIVAILTRHHLHARQVLKALQNGKSVFCEKPLAISPAELDEITKFLISHNAPRLMVGFNRRFAPFAVRLKDFLQSCREPFVAQYRINAGYLPSSHWLHDPAQGGGRIIGEGCHFIDFCVFLAGASPRSISAAALPDGGRYHQDNVLLTLTFPDGSLASISYLANGDKSLPKEQLEVFCAGRVARLDDFRTLQLVKDGKSQVIRNPLRQDKGHAAAWRAFLSSIGEQTPAPIPYDQLWGVTQTTFSALEALSSGQRISIPNPPTAMIPEAAR